MVMAWNKGVTQAALRSYEELMRLEYADVGFFLDVAVGYFYEISIARLGLEFIGNDDFAAIESGGGVSPHSLDVYIIPPGEVLGVKFH